MNDYLRNTEYKLTDEAVHLLFAMNRWEVKEEIMRDLMAGINVICDRYAFSGVAYSSAKVCALNLILMVGFGLRVVQMSRQRTYSTRLDILH